MTISDVKEIYKNVLVGRKTRAAYTERKNPDHITKKKKNLQWPDNYLVSNRLNIFKYLDQIKTFFYTSAVIGILIVKNQERNNFGKLIVEVIGASGRYSDLLSGDFIYGEFATNFTEYYLLNVRHIPSHYVNVSLKCIVHATRCSVNIECPIVNVRRITLV